MLLLPMQLLSPPALTRNVLKMYNDGSRTVQMLWFFFKCAVCAVLYNTSWINTRS